MPPYPCLLGIMVGEWDVGSPCADRLGRATSMGRCRRFHAGGGGLSPGAPPGYSGVFPNEHPMDSIRRGAGPRGRKPAMAKRTRAKTQPARSRMRVETTRGHLQIGNDWNAISIIALTQSNPLKAVAEFVENSIDAGAKRVTITRGKEAGKPFLRIADDGAGIPLDDGGAPNFKYVATHICDSVKRQLKTQGRTGIQGEFGIGLLSFWTVGENLSVVSAGRDGKTYEMRMRRCVPTYDVVKLRRLVADPGTEVTVRPLLSGLRQLSGEKLQWYLASELRDRIRLSGVSIRIVDRQARAEYVVEPRQFTGQLLHLPAPRCAARRDLRGTVPLRAQR